MRHKPFILSIKALIRDEAGRYLVLKRSPRSKGNAGKWDFPGGKVDPGESLDQGLRREVAEETGLVVSPQHVAGTAQSELPERIVAYLIVEARLESGEVCLSEEHEAHTWVPRAQLGQLDLAEPFRAFARSFSLDSAVGAGKCVPGTGTQTT